MKIIFVSLAVVVAGCGTKTTKAPPQSQQQIQTIQGQVFIVLKSRETLKLSLVPVALVESNAATSYVSARRSEFNARIDSLEQAMKAIDSRLAEVTATAAPLEAAAEITGRLSFQKHEEAAKIKSNFDDAWDRYTSAQRTTARATYKKACDERDAAFAKAERARHQVTPSRQQTEQLRVERFKLDEQRHEVKLVEDLFENSDTPWPSSAVTETDADGKFAFQISTGSNYVIVAKASRQVLDETEHYHWFVPVTENIVNLHNANLFSELVGNVLWAYDEKR